MAESDDPVQLLNELLPRVIAGFEGINERLDKSEKRIDEAHNGVGMTLAGLDGIQASIAALKAGVANGFIELSSRIENLREGVASQVHTEVEKAFDGTKSLEELPDRPQEER